MTWPILKRRALPAIALAGLAAANCRPAAAQQAAGRVRSPAMPCGSGPDDIVGLVLDGTGAPSGTVVVFGQAFRAGDLPRGAGLAARLADGRMLPVQADITTRHADGSALFAVVSLAAPALRAGERAAVMLSRASGAAAAALDLAAAGAGRAALIEIAPADGGAPWRIDLLLRAQDALAAQDAALAWQRGPLALQARVQAQIPPAAVGGVASARLVADVALRADGTLWVEAWVRNDIAMLPAGGTATYALRLLLDGQERLQSGPVRHFQYTGWGRLRGAARGGPAPTPPLVQHDIAYLAEAGAIARYDLSTGVDEAFLAGMARMAAAPDWQAPFALRGLTRAMGTAGNRADIGPTTAWQAAWLVTGDRRAASVCLDQAEAAGSIPWHFWSPAGGADGRGGWMDTRRWPNFWTDPRGGRAPLSLLQQPDPESGWQPIQSHQPDLCFVPYLLSGRRAFLDGLLAQGVMCILTQWPFVRAEATGAPAVRDVNIVHRNQVRGAAWSLRQLDNAGWIAPEGDPTRGFLRAAAAANWAWIRAQAPGWTTQQGEAHGWVPGQYTAGMLPPWQQDFLASSAIAAARRGNADARAALQWMANFLVGRFLAEAQGFPPRDGVAYNLGLTPPGAPDAAPPARTWAALAEATRARNASNGAGWQQSGGYYGQVALQSLAGIVDVLDTPEARRAYDWLLAAAPPFTRPEDFARDPTWNIVPKGRPRVPGQVQRCTTVAAARPA